MGNTYLFTIEFSNPVGSLQSLNTLKNGVRISKNVLVLLIEKCPMLTVVNIDNIDIEITDDIILAFAEKCPRLVELTIQHLSDHYINSNISDIAIESLVIANPQIESLVLDPCTSLTDKSLNCVAQHCHHFRDLVCYGGSAEIMDKSACLFIESNHRTLRVLDLSCTLITDQTILSLYCCTELVHVYLMECSLVTKEQIFELQEKIPSLKIEF
ncbi:hypothetical protein C1646_773830 [Rhizophagus diaphanus]|nr:hypothetical protein C1646_773830 [Rhizophagus diaphanus] [Rhizophagus sp. MUCL 43196]